MSSPKAAAATNPALPKVGHMGPPMPGETEMRKPHDRKGTLRRLWMYLQRQRLALVFAALLVCGTAGLDLLGPYLLGRAIDQGIAHFDLAALRPILALMLTVYATSAALHWLQNYTMVNATQRTVRDIRRDLFAKIQQMPLPFFDSRAHGDLMSRVTSDVENFSEVLSGSVTQITSGVLGTVGVVVAMLWINPSLALVSVLTVGSLTVLVNRWIAKRAREGFRQQAAALGRLNGFIEETLGGQRVVKAYHREEGVTAQFDTANRELKKSALRAQLFGSISAPVMNAINNTALTTVAGVGGIMAVRGLATVGTIATFINYTRQLGRPLNEIGMLYNQIQSAMASAERVFEIIDQPAEVDAAPGATAPVIQGEVEFTEVTFGYRPETPVLREVSLHARAGQTIALIGPTGAGKTTLVNLLTRFYEVDRGMIRIDGRDLREIPKTELRRQLGVVLQDTYLFSGTVRDNLRYGKLDATDAEIATAAHLANADLFIHRLPDGYDTVLSERGGNLSHGQRQLLAITRAILANPRILILDEATSSVDTRTEKHIQEAMRRLMSGRTCFVIAHRLSTIRDADQILVLNHGQIVERGNHAQLMERAGLYSRLYTRSLLRV
ncbi:MAG: multidrug ABC transporter ATP-binding protein [Verrucomicrobia bacterium Tous-C9LFEB]|nr:MAG: multidrug ABC transporter ATP-binding protein [Verrucomicrobia bacterium Tous-C9LFEB]